MSIGCGICEGDGDWWYYGPQDYSILGTKRSRRCFSCNHRIAVGDECAAFPRARSVRDEWSVAGDIEERIYGDEVPLATWYACEECAGVYFSLVELGYCLLIGDGMSMKENARMAGGGTYD